MASRRLLKQTLDELYSSYVAEFRRSPRDFFESRRDPLLFPHRYRSFGDAEAAAFLAATFAYGNVTSLCDFLERLLLLLRPSPYAFLKQGPAAVEALEQHRLYYRLHKSAEILAVLKMLARVYAEYESLYRIFLNGYDDSSTMKAVLERFVGKLRGLDNAPSGFLVPSPQDGSACKRLNLFLRWMVRRDGLDLGIWRQVSPSRLIMPVDTHIGRVAYRFGWIKTPSLNWHKAEQITEVLRQFDPQDPVRYDFSLCHESISRSGWLKELLRARKPHQKGK